MALSVRAISFRERRVAAQPELFTEEGMAPRFLGEASIVLAGVAGSLNRVDDAAVSRAAAQVAIQRFGDRLTIVCPIVLDERCRTDEDSRNAESTLHAALEHERFAEHAPGLVWKPFERAHFVTVHLFGLPQARERRAPIDQHQAASADAFGRTSVLRGENAALLAQHFEEVHARLVGHLGRRAVQGELDCGHSIYVEAFYRVRQGAEESLRSRSASLKLRRTGLRWDTATAEL